MASILLFTEHPNQRLLDRIDLEDAGHRVQTPETQTETLQQISRDPPDLVVLGPHRSMRQTLRLLADIYDKAPNLPIIIYTAESLFGDDYRYFLADACLTRHSDTTELLNTISGLADQARTTTEAYPKAWTF